MGAATAAGEARRHALAAWRARRSRAACGSTPPSAGGGGPWERQVERLLVLHAFRAAAPAELQELLRDMPAAAAALAGHAAAGAGRQRCAPALAHDADALADVRTPAA